jgi:serine O-acetyltransferase
VTSSSDLAAYTAAQLNSFFPDGNSVNAAQLCPSVDLARQRLEYSLSRCVSGPTPSTLDVLHSDRYCMFLYLLSNSVYRQSQDTRLATKVFYLNKALHAFNCMYDAELPSIFLLIHVIGTVLGKAQYSDYLVVGQNCTVGAIRGEYPTFGKRVILGAGASVIGKCQVGDDVMFAPGAQVLMRDIPSNSLVRPAEDIELRPYAGNAARTYFRLP